MNAFGVASTNIDKSIQPVSLMKRLLSSLIDFLCVIIFSLGIYTGGKAIINATTNFDSRTVLQNRMIEHLVVNSGLFIVENEGEDDTSSLDDKFNAIVSIYTKEELESFNSDQKEQYIEFLNARFDELFSGTKENYTHTTVEQYNLVKKSYEGLFELNENNQYVLVEKYDFNRLMNFYTKAWSTAFELIQLDTVYVNCVNEINKIESLDKLNLYLSVAIVSTIIFLIIPLCSKYYSTLGKKIMKIVVVDMEKEEIPAKNKFILRFLVLLVGEIIFSFEVFAIPLLISFTSACFSKKKTALHDYAAKTKVILLSDYLAAEEYKKTHPHEEKE